MKQSSIEWLMSELAKSGLLKTKKINNLAVYIIAKEMHKEEIEDAWRDGRHEGALTIKNQDSYGYYNETFNTKEK